MTNLLHQRLLCFLNLQSLQEVMEKGPSLTIKHYPPLVKETLGAIKGEGGGGGTVFTTDLAELFSRLHLAVDSVAGSIDASSDKGSIVRTLS